MHRLSSVTKHPKTSSKLINSRTSNIQRDQGHRRRFPSHTERAASCHGIDSGMGNRNWSCVYKNACQGGLISQMFFRSASYFHVHPEKLKQVIKERDGQTLCSYYDSDIYKMKAVGMVEEQNRVLDEGTPQSM